MSKKSFEKILIKIEEDYSVNLRWPDEKLLNELIKNDYKHEIKDKLLNGNLNWFTFAILLSVYQRNQGNDVFFLKELLLNNISDEKKVDYILRALSRLIDVISKDIKKELNLEPLLDEILNKYYFNKFNKCKNKLSFRTPCSVWIIQMIISLFWRLNYVKSKNKLKIIVKTQEKNEPKLYYEAKEALEKMGVE